MVAKKRNKKSLQNKIKNEKETNKGNFLVNFYKNNYKKLLIIPILMFIFGLVMIINTQKIEDSPIYRDVSLKGGLTANIDIVANVENLQSALKKEFKDNSFILSEVSEGGKQSGFIVDTDLQEKKLIPFLEKTLNTQLNEGENYTSNFISPQLSNAFFTQAMYILLISFVLMSLVVFMYFKEFVPSFAVVLSAIFDITVTVGILNFLKFKISIAGIGALLMLIGYSIDTDVLLTNRLVRERGTNYFEKTLYAFKTGSLMSATTLIASIIALILTNSQIISEIVFILTIGLLVDYVSTWIQNSAILLWWIEKK